MELTIPRTSRGALTISIEMGQQLYVVGANGTGKSVLIQHFIDLLKNNKIRRISAHRRTWLHPVAIHLLDHHSYLNREKMEEADRRADAGYAGPDSDASLSAVFFDFVAQENVRARNVARHIDKQDPEKAAFVASNTVSPFRRLNELLALGGLRVSLDCSSDEMIWARHKDADLRFLMAAMSDGERSATIMAATVLTVSPGTVIFIDEPERHLHRSIIEPFLSALFEQRKDCAFVVSTHEVALPVGNPRACTVILRSCHWTNHRVTAWDAELLQPDVTLPEDIKRDILGARRRILFVEGGASSLDLPMYGALFPELSVIPKGSCNEVIRAVKGLRGSYEHHHVEVVGLVDRDDHTENEVNELAEDGVFALDVCSVESLYYCSDAMEAVARRQAESLGCDPQGMYEGAKRKALEAIRTDEELPERMAGRRSERQVYNRFVSHLPDWRAIKADGEHLAINGPIENPYQSELSRFKSLVEARDLDGLTSRYPLRESSVLERIGAALGCRMRADYERMVVARVREDEGLAAEIRRRIRPLAEYLSGGTRHGS